MENHKKIDLDLYFYYVTYDTFRISFYEVCITNYNFKENLF